VLFDLDGTLADSAGELVAAFNEVRAARGLGRLPARVLRPYVSGGARALLAAGLGLTAEHADYAGARDAFLAAYARRLGSEARLFDGMAVLLEWLAAHGVRWGVVTNKLRPYAQPLLARMGLEHACGCLVTPNDVARAKPDPEGTRAACAHLGVQPAEVLFVGDDARDIAAGRAAGTRTAVALWGYLAPGERPVRWGAGLLCPSPPSLGRWIQRAAAVPARAA
jgi:N-acetyl-D-muramate 6-phosphate phosphatase